MSGRVRSVSANVRTLLDACWEVAAAPAGSTPADLVDCSWHAARVPGTAADALRSAGLWSFDNERDFDAEDWWWRLRFRADHGPATLGFDGIATLAEVWLDGQRILDSDNMFVAHAVPVTLSGTHELLIHCRSLARALAEKRPRPGWRVPMLESQQLRWVRTTLLGRTPGWSPPCAAVGPWRDVWIEQAALPLGAISVDSSVDGTTGAGLCEIAAELGEAVASARVVLSRGAQRVTADLKCIDGCWRATANVEQPALWWPHTHGDPACYGVCLEVFLQGASQPGPIVVELGSTGFRTLEIDREGGDFAVHVNGVEVFCRGACWTPLDIVSLCTTPDVLRAALQQVRESGMNMLRVSGTMVYEDDAFLDALDAEGILLWQDLMFANMDYPQDPAFNASVSLEVQQQLARLRGRPCLALVCGNSEGRQQAAMSSTSRERWAMPLFDTQLAGFTDAIGAHYIPSSAQGGAFPHAANVGTCSYYGVGAYLRPFEDARHSNVRFASECLAFANIPEATGLPVAASLRVHHPLWKRRAPRDLGAGWDFDDVRDHYVELLYETDATRLRVSDHDRYLALGRAATGEAMARVFAEWRRVRSPTRGGLVWFLRDLWPGAGWGLVDAHGAAKPCLHALRRVLAPQAITIIDEGVNGLALHAFNDGPDILQARIELSLYRDGDIRTGTGTRVIPLPAHGAIELAATDFFDGFVDLSFAYRFGPPVADVVHATLWLDDRLVSDAFWFPAGMACLGTGDIGLESALAAGESRDDFLLTVGSRCFAHSVCIEAAGFVAEDNGFHLAPGQSRQLRLHRAAEHGRTPRGTVTALNSSTGARFALQ
ncbi:MAG: glycoside hydrolase family 2 protein [Pseudoxanthomonas sp.]